MFDIVFVHKVLRAVAARARIFLSHLNFLLVAEIKDNDPYDATLRIGKLLLYFHSVPPLSPICSV